MIKGGPRIVNDGIVFCIDTADIKCVSKAGCMGFTNAAQLLKNLISRSDTITTTSNLRLGNLSFFTIYSLTYPEGNYNPSGADGVRDGITPGFNDITSSEVLDFSRDLNYAVWDNATNNWVADSYFNGERIAGHCYDTYDTNGNAATEHVQFQDDYRDIVTAYPDATHIVCGSHAAENNDSDANTLAILQDLGGPSSWPTDRAEYVLIGKPGLGAGNAYVWQYQNDSANVAHANVGLPILGRKTSGQNYLDFDGSSDLIGPNTFDYDDSSGEFTVCAWVNPDTFTSSNSYAAIINRTDNSNHIFSVFIETTSGSGTTGEMAAWFFDTGGTIRQHKSSGQCVLNLNEWNFCVWRFADTDGYTFDLYNSDGSVSYNASSSYSIRKDSTSQFTIGRWRNAAYFYNGQMSSISVYKKKLSNTEVLQNYNATKSRFL